MPDSKISQLSPATALTGAELLELVQSGVNVRSTVSGVRSGLGTGNGSVTSVQVTAPSGLLVASGGPVTGSGTLALTLATQASGVVFAGPTSGSGAPSFRQLNVAEVSGAVASVSIVSGNTTLILTGTATNPQLRANVGTGSGTLAAGDDARLSNSRPPTGTASGQLGGTYPNPEVRGLRETSGPTLLTLGAIADGQFLIRTGSTVVGSSASAVTTMAFSALTPTLAAANPGRLVLATGVAAFFDGTTVQTPAVPFLSDGVDWRLLNGRQLIYYRAVVQTLTGTGAEQEFTSFRRTIPANLITLSRNLLIEQRADFSGNTLNGMSIKVGGVNTYTVANGTARSMAGYAKVWPDGVLTSLRHYAGGSNSTGIGASTGNPPAPIAVDTTAAFDVSFHATNPTTESANLRYAAVWLEGY